VFCNSGNTYAPVNDGDGFSDAPSLDGSIYVNYRRWVAGTIAVTGDVRRISHLHSIPILERVTVVPENQAVSSSPEPLLGDWHLED